MKKKILILGGTGFIGYHLARKFLSLNWKVVSISTNKPIKNRRLKKVTYLICDISKKKKLKNCLKEKFQFIINASGHINHSSKLKTKNSHYTGVKNLVMTLKKNIKCFIQLGSSSEYGKVRSPQKESYKCSPKMIYGKSKYLTTNYLLDLYKKENFPAIILRLYQVYGPNQSINRLIPFVIKQSLSNKNFFCSAGIQKRDFLYIDDCVRAVVASINKRKQAIGQIINIGSSKPKKIKNVILYLKKKIGFGTPEFNKIPLRPDEGLVVYPDIKKARKLLDWKPKINFVIGITKTLNFYSSKKN